MSKIDLEDNNVFTITTTPDAIRKTFDGESFFDVLGEDFELQLDSAQGAVFTGDAKVAYFIIEIRK